MDISLQRGAVPLTLDRTYMLFFEMRATGLLYAKYGPTFLAELYEPNGSGGIKLKSVEALSVFLWAGLQADARARGKDFTLEHAEALISPFALQRIFDAVLTALGRSMTTPLPKAGAPGVSGAPGAAADPGPTRVSTSSKRSASRTASSAGRKKPSGRRP